MKTVTAPAERGILMSPFSVKAILADKKTATRRLVDAKRLRIRPRSTVRADFADLIPEARGIEAKGGQVVHAHLNQHGAVTAELGGGRGDLGMRPEEFDFLCPFAHGTTVLAPKGSDAFTRPWIIKPEPGQVLWVRETFAIATGAADDLNVAVRYDLDGLIRPLTLTVEQRAKLKRHNATFATRSGLLMPRWASRLTLLVVEVRLERLRWLEHATGSRLDVLAEGIVERIDDAGHKGFEAVYGPYGEAATSRTPWGAYAAAWNKIHKDVPWDTNPWVWVVSFKKVEGA